MASPEGIVGHHLATFCPPLVQVLVRNLDGSTFPIMVRPRWLVDKLRVIIFERSGVPPHLRCLLMHAPVMQDGVSPGQLNLSSTLAPHIATDAYDNDDTRRRFVEAAHCSALLALHLSPLPRINLEAEGTFRGHDFSQKVCGGATRIAAINLAPQATSKRDSPQGRGWIVGKYVRDLGLDVALCSEVGRMTEPQLMGFREGLQAHNQVAVAALNTDTGSSTMIIFQGGNEASDVYRHKSGRLCFASLQSFWTFVDEAGVLKAETRTVRVRAIYGITGGSTREPDTEGRILEADLIRCTTRQLEEPRLSGCLIVIGGDFNCAEDPAVDAVGDRYRRRERSLFSAVLADSLLDFHRLHRPMEVLFTRTGKSGGRARLDYILVGEDRRILPIASAFHSSKTLLSDHDSPIPGPSGGASRARAT
ncbi:hypothetical protein CYMTET_9938 [Cymbomonas tetramitiformis]|uniref:Ubiquitin-like domain-containing protein n=1 Tax=Cymbomonas tetramitiformis TaxID=36881 RepID=A0AAE0GQF5_9CHLO|nr:hypothetical protein CYMTET_9938 [Cymbomonas tetramitiformis]